MEKNRKKPRLEMAKQPEIIPAQRLQQLDTVQRFPARQQEVAKMPIGQKQILEASEILKKYKDGKANLEARLIENEEFWKLNHWKQFQTKSFNENDPRPASAWLFNSVNNKHADAMDNYPEPNILPREKSDENVASALSEIIPVVLENNEFEETYSDGWWDKLKGGTAAYGVFWDNSRMNGLGDVSIRPLELLNIFWEPGIQDIQKSRNLFIVELVDNDLLETTYPQLAHKLQSSTIDVAEYHYDDTVDTTEKSAVVDWYYKKNGKLHYVKYVNDTVLYASENEPDYAERGYYDDGEYPVVFDVLFPEKGTPAGFGYIDIMKDPQMYIDKIDSSIMKNAVLLSKPRYFMSDSAQVNEQEYMDYSKDVVHVAGSFDETKVKKIEVDEIPAVYLQVKENKVEELKETSGNRDFSQGATTSGVTAASAIAALQEAGSKTSRDMIKAAYRAYASIVKMAIERIRQFYDEPRSFRIVGPNNEIQFKDFDNTMMQPQGGGVEFGVELKGRLPIFDIKVRPQKSSPFSKIAQNELAKELYGMGAFNPELSDQAYACVDMMDFEGKDEVLLKIQQNGLMYQKMMQMQQSMMQMAQLIAQTTGDTRIVDALASQGIQGTSMPQLTRDSEETETNSLGEVTKKAENSQAGKARARVASSATPKV